MECVDVLLSRFEEAIRRDLPESAIKRLVAERWPMAEMDMLRRSTCRVRWARLALTLLSTIAMATHAAGDSRWRMSVDQSSAFRLALLRHALAFGDGLVRHHSSA